jgi:PPE family protein/PE family protein
VLVDLWVQVDELHAAGTRMAQSVAVPIPLTGVAVTPAAADQVSATVAAAVSARLHAIGTHSTHAAYLTTTAAAVLHANAETYGEQEDRNTALLRPGGAATGAAVSAPTGLALDTAPPQVAPLPATPVGVTPSDGKAVATLIHGGTGPGPLLAAAQAVRIHATKLRAISTDLRGTSDRLGQAWQSPAAEVATGRIATLACWYDDHAQHAVTTARACEAHADSVSQARAAIPRPEVFEDLERRLQAASCANVIARGAYAPVITALQTQLRTTHAQALTAYADYTTRSADLFTDTPTPPPQPTVQAVDNHTIKETPPVSPDTPDSGPPKPIHDGRDVQDLLKHFERGSRGVRQVEWPQDVRRLYDTLVRNSVGEAPPTKTPYGYGGPTFGRVLDDGTVIRMRPTSGSGGPTIDVQYPWGGGEKVHIPRGATAPIISELPNLPPAAHPPLMLPPPQVGHSPVQLPSTEMFDPNGLPSWLQTSSPPGFALLPSQPPMIMPGQVVSSPPIEAAPAASAAGPSLLDAIGHDLSSVGHGLAEAGETAGKGILVGVAVLGALFGTAVTSSGQVAR